MAYRQRQRDAALGKFVRVYGLLLLQVLTLSLAAYGGLVLVMSLG